MKSLTHSTNLIKVYFIAQWHCLSKHVLFLLLSVRCLNGCVCAKSSLSVERIKAIAEWTRSLSLLPLEFMQELQTQHRAFLRAYNCSTIDLKAKLLVIALLMIWNYKKTRQEVCFFSVVAPIKMEIQLHFNDCVPCFTGTGMLHRLHFLFLFTRVSVAKRKQLETRRCGSRLHFKVDETQWAIFSLTR